MRHYFGMLAEQDLKLCSSQSLSKKFNYRKSKPTCFLYRVDYMGQHIQKFFQLSVKGNTNVRRQGMKFSLCTTGAMLKDICAGLDLVILKDPVQPQTSYNSIIH